MEEYVKMNCDKSLVNKIKIELRNSSGVAEEQGSRSDVLIKTEERDIEATVELEQIKAQWPVGQVVWARMSNFPYWPSIITIDPTTKEHVLFQSKYYQIKVKIISYFLLSTF